jgi:hypothetical protein
MRTEQYHAYRLVELLRERKIATMPELKAVLKTDVDVTVFRKLREVPYRTSYSHGGSFYTLDEIAEFDALGLWSHREVHFSVHGNLLSTLEAFLNESEAGHFVSELENLLQVGVKESLLKLVRRERIAREKMLGLYLYCSRDPSVRKRQILRREILEAQPILTGGLSLGRIVPDELKAAIVLFFSVLDEKQRRLYAGLESLKFGHGGDEKIAELLGLDVRTIARGRRQLLQRDLEIERVRKAGGGRKPLEKKRPK